MKVISNIFSAPCFLNILLAAILLYISRIFDSMADNSDLLKQLMGKIYNGSISNTVIKSIITPYILVYLLNYFDHTKSAMFFSTSTFIPISFLTGILFVLKVVFDTK